MCQVPTADSPVIDADIVAGCLAGRPEAWNALLARYGRLLRGLACGHGLCESDADDVMQEVLLISVRRLRTLRDPDRLAGWLRRIVQRESLHEARRPRPSPLPAERISARARPPDDEAIARETREALEQALEMLDGVEQRIIVGLFGDGRSYRAIGADLGMSDDSIGPARARCLRKLRNALAPPDERRGRSIRAISPVRPRAGRLSSEWSSGGVSRLEST